MMVRTSDIRVSERVCLSSLTLDKFSTVYNDLIDEVSILNLVIDIQFILHSKFRNRMWVNLAKVQKEQKNKQNDHL